MKGKDIWSFAYLLFHRYDCVLAGHLFKRCSDSNKWLIRWFRLYQVSMNLRRLDGQTSVFNPKNLLFYYDGEQSSKPAGVIFLEVGAKRDTFWLYLFPIGSVISRTTSLSKFILLGEWEDQNNRVIRLSCCLFGGWTEQLLIIQALHKRHYWCSYRGLGEFSMRPNGKHARGIEELQLPFEIIVLRRVATARGFLQRLQTTLTEDRPTPTGPRSPKTERRNQCVLSSFLNTFWWLLTFWYVSYVSG